MGCGPFTVVAQDCLRELPVGLTGRRQVLVHRLVYKHQSPRDNGFFRRRYKLEDAIHSTKISHLAAAVLGMALLFSGW